MSHHYTLKWYSSLVVDQAITLLSVSESLLINSLCAHRSLSNNVGRDKSCLNGLGERGSAQRRGSNGVLQDSNDVPE